jgi:hypothetical protein
MNLGLLRRHDLPSMAPEDRFDRVPVGGGENPAEAREDDAALDAVTAGPLAAVLSTTGWYDQGDRSFGCGLASWTWSASALTNS